MEMKLRVFSAALLLSFGVPLSAQESVSDVLSERWNLSPEEVSKVEPVGSSREMGALPAAVQEQASEIIAVKVDQYEPPLDKHPFSTTGKLVIQWPGGGVSWCTAQFVDNPDQLLTAAHCVYKRGVGWPQRMIFFQRYKDGFGRPVEIGNSCIAVPQQYLNNEDANKFPYVYDIAYIRTKEPTDTSFVPTWLQFGEDAEYAAGKPVTAVGYPSGTMSGERLIAVNGRVDSYSNRLSGVKRMAGNTMTPGSSGGAWYHYDAEGRPLVVGVNSFTIVGVNGEMWSALIDQANIPRLGECLNECTNPCDY